MISMNPYLHFAGKCREALEFYKGVFGGEISGVQTYGQAQMGASDEMQDNIIHSEFRADGVFLMASDSPAADVHPGDNVALSLNITDLAEAQRVFEGLANGGAVTFPFEKTFWGATFGMLTDKYGINWMVNAQ